jgi:hypothetical protein
MIRIARSFQKDLQKKAGQKKERHRYRLMRAQRLDGEERSPVQALRETAV